MRWPKREGGGDDDAGSVIFNFTIHRYLLITEHPPRVRTLLPCHAQRLVRPALPTIPPIPVPPIPTSIALPISTAHTPPPRSLTTSDERTRAIVLVEKVGEGGGPISNLAQQGRDYCACSCK
ncbi:hypothetical protein P167DRAFT_336372 [Morchella conica CCBAS932]|uniref:Uncharacterized protein n=1 Tax=Morchella conica CCBAS932 TaxID=1392247 RepID=A0A3N4KSD9_9PEZI|nr:hypothetical protein P167DRAFT_336372 [Morchella conica CCBAS932]